MYVAKVPNRGSPPAILLRESYREDGKVKNRTLSNLSHWPQEKVDALSAVLKGLPPKHSIEDSFSIIRSLPHGHVAAVLGMIKNLGLDSLIDVVPSRFRGLVLSMIVSQVIDPDCKLSISRALRSDTASSSLGEVLELGSVDVNELYGAMDELLLRQKDIEDQLAHRHLEGATLVLYDASAAAFEDKTCPLGVIGHPKDGVRGRLQIVYGLLTSLEGVPIAIEVFTGNTADPKTIPSQLEKIKERFGIT
ncbi:MAG: IS1634 family transposase, partial [Acidimicrobiaceae bacterium]|nr:IS1634 family transposase [Acidimicrobiaceae bacterium]